MTRILTSDVKENFGPTSHDKQAYCVYGMVTRPKPVMGFGVNLSGHGYAQHSERLTD